VFPAIFAVLALFWSANSLARARCPCVPVHRWPLSDWRPLRARRWAGLRRGRSTADHPTLHRETTFPAYAARAAPMHSRAGAPTAGTPHSDKRLGSRNEW